MYCINCGSNLEPNMKFCPKCGKMIANTSGSETQTGADPSQTETSQAGASNAWTSQTETSQAGASNAWTSQTETSQAGASNAWTSQTGTSQNAYNPPPGGSVPHYQGEISKTPEEVAKKHKRNVWIAGICAIAAIIIIFVGMIAAVTFAISHFNGHYEWYIGDNSQPYGSYSDGYGSDGSGGFGGSDGSGGFGNGYGYGNDGSSNQPDTFSEGRYANSTIPTFESVTGQLPTGVQSYQDAYIYSYKYDKSALDQYKEALKQEGFVPDEPQTTDTSISTQYTKGNEYLIIYESESEGTIDILA